MVGKTTGYPFKKYQVLVVRKAITQNAVMDVDHNVVMAECTIPVGTRAMVTSGAKTACICIFHVLENGLFAYIKMPQNQVADYFDCEVPAPPHDLAAFSAKSITQWLGDIEKGYLFTLYHQSKKVALVRKDGHGHDVDCHFINTDGQIAFNTALSTISAKQAENTGNTATMQEWQLMHQLMPYLLEGYCLGALTPCEYLDLNKQCIKSKNIFLQKNIKQLVAQQVNSTA